jgi:uncharacterized protein with GYD domain
MATYVSLVTFTATGIESIKNGGARLDAAKQGLQALGGELKGWYLTMGRYDVVFIFEAPDDETAAKGVLTLAAQGNVRTETMRAFSEEEYRAILASMP